MVFDTLHCALCAVRGKPVAGCHGNSAMSISGTIFLPLFCTRDLSDSPGSSRLWRLCARHQETQILLLQWLACWQTSGKLLHFLSCGNENTTCVLTSAGEAIKTLVPGFGFLQAKHFVRWDITITSVNQWRTRPA